MNKTKLKKILADMGAVPDLVFQPYRLKTVIMTANFGVDYLRDRMIYDSEDNMLKVKQYSYKRKSFEVNSNAKIEGDKLFSYNSMMFTSSEWPKVGGIVGLISKVNSAQMETYTIKALGMNFIQLEEEIDSNINLDDYYAIYFIGDTRYLAQDEINPTAFYEYKPYTTNPYDVYLDASKIIGFETLARRVGNS